MRQFIVSPLGKTLDPLQLVTACYSSREIIDDYVPQVYSGIKAAVDEVIVLTAPL